MRVRGLVCASLVLLAGCASQSVIAKPPSTIEGLSSDLRVFMDAQCLPPEGDERTGLGGGLLAELIVGTGNIALKSFGKALQEMGSPKLDRSTALRGGLFYAAGQAQNIRAESIGGAAPVRARINPEVRCIHIVRDGFSGPAGGDRTAPFAGAPPEFADAWRLLGLQNTPSFYAVVRLSPSADGTAFRGELIRMVATRFERQGSRHADRDYILHLEFQAPKTTRYYWVDEAGVEHIERGGTFARGGLQLARVKQGRYAAEADLKGKETGWMEAPGLDAVNAMGVFNLEVDLVELKRGDPLLADLGALLQSEPVGQAAQAEIRSQLDQDALKKSKAEASFTAQAQEVELVRKLEDESGAVNAMLGRQANAAALNSQIRKTEDAIFAIRKKAAVDGWKTSSPDVLVAKAQAILTRARQIVQNAQE